MAIIRFDFRDERLGRVPRDLPEAEAHGGEDWRAAGWRQLRGEAATRLPAVTVPVGFPHDGMPVGVELLGRAFSEPDRLRLAEAFEPATHHRHPPALTPRLR